MKRFFARWAVVVLASLAPVTMRAVGAPSRTAQARTAQARVAKGSAAKPAAHVDHAVVGLGGNVDYSLDVTTTSDDPVVTSPSPGKIPGFELIGWGSSVHPTLIKHDGKVQQVTAITITYRLRAKTLGTHVLGPGHFNVDGTRVDAPTVIVQVVPAASAPPPTKAPTPRDPFDDLFFEPEPAPAPPPKVVAPSDPLAMVEAVPTAPRDRMVFVRLAVDDDKPIVGAQMTAKLFIYRRRDVSIDGIKHAPGFADFHLLELNNPEKDWHPITIGGETWAYARLRTYAAFPLRSGKLTVEPGEIEMRAVLGGGFVSGEEEDHTTNTLEIEAIEPPIEGRPGGYLMGDVASALEVVADANPRVVTDGHALLTLKMRGTGRIDALHVNLPTTPGVHWTTTGDDVRTSVDGATVRGARKVSVDVALDNPGDVALGDAVIHVWDPAKKSYATV